MRVEVWYRKDIGDGRASRLLSSFQAGALPELLAIHIRDVYIVRGVPGLTIHQLEELVCDGVAQQTVCDDEIEDDSQIESSPWNLLVEVIAKPGVTDPVAITLRGALHSVLGHQVPESALIQTARQYRLSLTNNKIDYKKVEVLFNPLIQIGVLISREEWIRGRRPDSEYPTMNIGNKGSELVKFSLGKMTDQELIDLSKERTLALTLSELTAVREYYQSPIISRRRIAAGIGAEATDIELEMIAQTWSEHCKHKIFNATIEYSEEGKIVTINSIFDTFIRATTQEVDPGDGFLRSVFSDNAGIIEFDPETLLCFKVETHNSPSALDPYGGAITGIVGVNRDIIGTGRGARPIFNTNVLCFAPANLTNVPKSLLPPSVVMEGVHRGIVDGGNQSGIPTVAGAVLFEPSYVGKPLVFCGTGGILPAYIDGIPSWKDRPEPEDLAVMVGGRIGQDGIHGATFSSIPLDDSSPLSAVQIGDPITQKKMSDFLMEARDLGLFRAITDNGAGGLSSSFGEMARDSNGIYLNLEKAPLKYSGLLPWEIMLSESQERMSLAVPPEKYKALSALAQRREVEVTVIGRFNDSSVVEVRHGTKIIAMLDVDFLHDGLPKMILNADWESPRIEMDVNFIPPDSKDILLQLLSDPNIASKESLVRQYDHEVQALTVGKPFVGCRNDGPSDGAVLRPLHQSLRGIAITHGICPWYSNHDTFRMAICAVDEAVRSQVAIGGNPDRMAALDNFCWPDPVSTHSNPENNHKLAQLVRAAKGLREACLAFRLPLISGKDSMKNDAVVDGRKISVVPTLLISLLGIVENISNSVSTDFKRAGDKIFVIGPDKGELGETSYARILATKLGVCPSVDLETAMVRYRLIHYAICAGMIASAHDISDGGLAVALAESTIGSRLGAQIDISRILKSGHISGIGNLDSTKELRIARTLFSETGGRLIVSVPCDEADQLKECFKDETIIEIGTVTSGATLTIVNDADHIAIWSVSELVSAWKTPL